MLRRYMSIISAIAYVAASTLPAIAADPLGSSGYDPFDIHHRSIEITPGAYLRIPFQGSIHHSLADSRFGLTLAARLPGQYGYRGRRGVLDTPKFIDLSVGLAGRDSLRLNGIRLVGTDALSADEDGKAKKKKGHIWPWVLGGTALLIGLSVLAADAAANDAADALVCGLTGGKGKDCQGG